MIRKALGLLGFGVAAYFLEYELDITRLPIAATLAIPAAIIGLLYAISLGSRHAGGRLPGSPSTPPLDSPSNKKADSAFVIIVIVYVGLFLNVLFRVAPRPIDTFGRRRLMAYLEALSPIELYWLIAPLVLLWWYRRSRDRGSQ